MRLLRIKLFQETVCFQKPFAFKIGETYPLAPFSTVKGMLHAVLDAKEYIPMNLSIQGKSESFMIDYAKKYMYKKVDAQLPLNMDGLEVDIEPAHVTAMPMYVHLLYRVEHVIHIEAAQDVLEKLYKCLSAPACTLSLGRWEDLVRIDEVAYVSVEESEEKVQASYDMYIPKSWIAEKRRREFSRDTIPRTQYRLPRKYEIKQGKRIWDYVPVLYVAQSQRFSKGIPFDGEYPIFLMEG